MNIQRRPATSEDKKFLSLLNEEASKELICKQFGEWDEEWQNQQFEGKLRRRSFEIIELDQKPIGALCIEELPTCVNIVDIEILPKFQNKGIGSEIINSAKMRAKKLGIPVRLQLLKMNPAQKLCERLGFREIHNSETYIEMEAR